MTVGMSQWGDCTGGRCHVVPGTDLFAPWFVDENAGGYDFPNP